MFDFTNNMQIVEIIISSIIAFVTFISLDKRSRLGLNMLQLHEYKNDEYSKWLKENKRKALSLNYEKKEEKSSLVITNRVMRLMLTNKKINGIIILLLFFIKQYFMNIAILPTKIFALAMILLYLYQPFIIMISNKINKPKEEKINRGFYESAQKKIKSMENLKVIGITGSFGKTSTKFLLETLLKDHFKVQNTPSSYNTPMGLSKVINNDLTDDKEIFIAELGAYKIGEIREVAQLVQPDIGIITAIGPTHMHLFKSVDNIMKAKYELIEELPEDGIAIFNYDNEYVKVLADKTLKKTIRYGMNNVEMLDIYAEDIVVDSEGSTFTIKDNEGNSARCKTKLLGKHNISNILAGVCVARALGVSLEEISKDIEKIEPVEHRLNIVKGNGGVTIIDDAFNSNPAGARAALDVLNQFKTGRKIIITPGMVELGDIEEEENYKLGKEIAKVCDYAILIGEKRTKPIAKGLLDENYSEDNIFVVNTLSDATNILVNLTNPGDVVLFENDLPDSYSES